MAAVGAVVAGVQASARRQRAAEASRKREGKIQRLIAKYDKSGTGRLEEGELRRLLTDLNGGKAVTDSEVKWVLVTADESDGSLNGAVDPHELLHAVNSFKSYKENAPFIETVMDRYDENRSGRLERGQLRELMTDLNDGKPATEADVDYVLSKADLLQTDGIDRPEVLYATSLWFDHCEAKNSRVCVLL